MAAACRGADPSACEHETDPRGHRPRPIDMSAALRVRPPLQPL